MSDPEIETRIAVVLHRLRTPLTAIKGWTDLALREQRQTGSVAELEQCLQQIRGAVTAMQQAIDDMAAKGREQPGSAADGARHREDVTSAAAATHDRSRIAKS